MGDWPALARQYNELPGESLPAQAYVWGAGSFGLELANRLAQAGTRVLGLVDRNARFWAQGVTGLPCFSPDDLFSRDRVPVAVGMHNLAADYRPIVESLSTAGFEVWLPQRLWRAAALGGAPWPAAFWLDFPFWGQQDCSAALAEARRVFELLADEASVRVFWGELCARALGNARFRANPERGQYAPPSLPRWPQPIRLIDAGAFNGDTLRFFSQSGLRVSQSLCFEPDHANFEALQASRSSEIDMMCLPLGLADRTKTLRFRVGEGGASRLSDDGKALIQCVGLDEAVPDYPATLLKMDIEGGELDALRGARNLIARSGCSMAISAYHTPDHLWKVPILMHQLAPQHPLFMRAHAFNGFDTVAYALPPEACALLRS